MASTGSNLEAEIAGSIPEIKPIAAETPVPIIMFFVESINSKSPAIQEAIKETKYTRTSPITPPIRARITASNKN